jgi:hypothetical protein
MAATPGRPRRDRRTKDEKAVGRPMRVALVVAAGLGLALAAVATFSGNVEAQNGNSGTIKVHDGASADPPTRNEPHVTGDAFVEGSNMAATEGTLNIFSWPPTGDKELVLATTWESDGGEPENHFLAGPFFLPCGHYRVEAQNGLEEDDFPGGVKSKMFWVECDETPPPTGTTTSTTTTTTTSASESSSSSPPPSETSSETETTTSATTTTTAPPPAAMECPTELAVTPNDDGTVTLTWRPAPGSDGTNVYRAVGSGDLEYVATAPIGVGSYVDREASPGGSYAYAVTGLFGNSESLDCPVVETTAIPDLPTLAAIGLAGGSGLAAFALRRRLA